jgi:hypothetical protein
MLRFSWLELIVWFLLSEFAQNVESFNVQGLCILEGYDNSYITLKP